MATKIKDLALKSSLFVAVVFVWYVLSALHIIPEWTMPSPQQTFISFLRLLSGGEILKLLGVSIMNIVPAFVCAVFAALILGTFVGINKTFSKMFLPFLSSIYLVPSLAWLPLIILFLGFSQQSIWTMVFISSFVRIIYNVIAGVRGVNVNWLLAAKNFELTRFETIVRIILPGALPQIISGIRVGFGSAWRSLIGAEMLVVSAGGLGKYIWMSQWDFKFEQVFAGIFIIAIIGIVAEEFIFKRVEKMTLEKWGLFS